MSDLDALASQIENDAILGSCDWGSCSNQQVGWARTTKDEAWLPICDPCRKRGTSKDAPGAFPVHEFVTFAQVWRWTHGEPLTAFFARSEEVPDARP
jgi:hypothetical protein